MSFIYAPIFWLGLGCVSLPIIIHLLNRRRFRVRPWAAMQFLLESLRRNRRRLQIEELILLLLRCLALLALAIAISRFFIEPEQPKSPTLPTTPPPQLAVFILDDSCSMGQIDRQAEPRPVFRTAAENIVGRIKKLPRGSKVAVLRASAPTAPPLLPLSPVKDLKLEDVKRRLDSLKPSDKRVALTDILAMPELIFKYAPQDAKRPYAKRLYVLSDFRTADLVPTDKTKAEILRIKAEFKALTDAKVQLVALDYGLKARNNLTIESVKLESESNKSLDRFVLAGEELHVAVTIRNNGSEMSRPGRLTGSIRFAPDDKGRATGLRDVVALDGQDIPAIAPGSKPWKVVCTLKRAQRTGAAVVTVNLPDDELPSDNQAHLVLNIRTALRALIVDGKPDLDEPDESESWPYRNAVDPNRNGDTNMAATVVTVDELADRDLSEYDIVALLNVGELPTIPAPGGKLVNCPTLRKLECYVRDGGGLVIHTGQKLNTAFYNGPFYAGSFGLSPFRIGEPLKSPTYFRFDPKSIKGEGPMKYFHGDWDVNVDLVRFMVVTPADEHSGSKVTNPRILARFNDGESSPAVVATQFDDGKVVMIYSSASDTTWNSWSKEGGAYVPAVRETVYHAARVQTDSRSAYVDQPIFYQLHSNRLGSSYSLKTPDPGKLAVALRPRTGFSPRAKFVLGKLADRMVDLSKDDAHGNRPIEALRQAAEKVKKALADKDPPAPGERADNGRATTRGAAGNDRGPTTKAARGDDAPPPAKKEPTGDEEMLNALNEARQAMTEAVQRGAPAAAGRDRFLARQWLLRAITGRAEVGLADMYGQQVRFERTDDRGVYELTEQDVDGTGKGELAFFARNIDPAEGKLAHNGRADLAAAVGSEEFLYNESDPSGAVAPKPPPKKPKKEYWLWAMGALLALLAIETFLAQLFGHYASKKQLA